jgi:hypothetical protein
LRYIKGTVNYGVLFPKHETESQGKLVGYTDFNQCGDRIDRRSTYGYVFLLNGATISWSSKKKPIIALSSC